MFKYQELDVTRMVMRILSFVTIIYKWSCLNTSTGNQRRGESGLFFIMKVGYINPRKIFTTCSFSKLFGVLKRWEFPLALPNVSAHKQNVWRYFFCNTVPKSLFQTGTIHPLPHEWAPWKYIIIADTSYGISKIEKYKHKLCPHPVSCQTCEN